MMQLRDVGGGAFGFADSSLGKLAKGLLVTFDRDNATSALNEEAATDTGTTRESEDDFGAD